MRRLMLIVGVAITAYSASVALGGQAPTSAGVQVQFGDLLFADGRYVDAQDAYRRAVAAEDSALAVRAGAGLVLALLRTADFQEAFDVSSGLGRRHPTNPTITAMRGDALWSIGRFEEAEASYDASLVVDPTSPAPGTAAPDRSRRGTGSPTR